MKMTVVGKTGVRRGTFQGREWSHVKLYVTHEDPTINDLNGDVAECLKIPEKININGLNPGDTIDVEFNRFGKVSVVELC